ncbi:MAG TPA: Gfo/Idh/MocA family oxidoreductase, partial [Solimonas sp.]|nr:Gfo/Idh/MocA family oxidoreductase [Solimonas sp.]
MSAPVRVGLIGLGTVGQGVLRVLHKNAGEIARRVGRPVVVTVASVRDLARKRDGNLDGVKLVADSEWVAREADVDIVVELIGGQTAARDLILAAIARGKHVVTANKALLAEDGNRIFEAARKAGVMVAFEAAVAGGIPVIKTI